MDTSGGSQKGGATEPRVSTDTEQASLDHDPFRDEKSKSNSDWRAATAKTTGIVPFYEPDKTMMWLSPETPLASSRRLWEVGWVDAFAEPCPRGRLVHGVPYAFWMSWGDRRWDERLCWETGTLSVWDSPSASSREVPVAASG